MTLVIRNAVAAEWAAKILSSRNAAPYRPDYDPDETEAAARKQASLVQSLLDDATKTWCRRAAKDPVTMTEVEKRDLAVTIACCMRAAAAEQWAIDSRTCGLLSLAAYWLGTEAAVQP